MPLWDVPLVALEFRLRPDVNQPLSDSYAVKHNVSVTLGAETSCTKRTASKILMATLKLVIALGLQYEKFMEHYVKRHYLFIDESGAKGYADNRERYPGELGVIAGYLVPELYLSEYRAHLEKRLASIDGVGKLHITDLLNQSEARGVIFQAFLELEIPWIYEAIYVEGLYQSEFCEGRGGDGSHKELLHAKLFMGFMIKALALVHKFKDEGVEIVVVSDNIDAGVIKKFLIESEDYLSLLRTSELKREFKVYQKSTGKLLHCSSRATAENIPSHPGLELGITCENSHMTLLSDVLANSVNHYLKMEFESNPQMLPNSKQAISNHPLRNLLLCSYDENSEEIFNISDIIYRREEKHLEQKAVELDAE